MISCENTRWVHAKLLAVRAEVPANRNAVPDQVIGPKDMKYLSSFVSTTMSSKKSAHHTP